MITHDFKKPVDFEGAKHESIAMDLDALTGRDISQVKSEWAMDGKFSPVPSADLDFCAMIACRAAGLPKEFADALPARDYLAVTQKVSNFLLGSD